MDASGDEKNQTDAKKRHNLSVSIRRAMGVFGVLLTIPFLLWLPLGYLDVVPSMIEVFGMEGLRTPTSFVIGGLLIAALGFYEI